MGKMVLKKIGLQSTLLEISHCIMGPDLVRMMFSGLDNWHKPGIIQPAVKAEGLIIIIKYRSLLATALPVTLMRMERVSFLEEPSALASEHFLALEFFPK